MKRRILLLKLLCGFTFAQEEFSQLEDMLARGLYNSAALVAGPALVEAYPEDRRAFELYARALLLSGDAEAAADAYGAMLQLGEPEPVTASEKHLAGLIMAGRGDPAAAAELLEAAFRESGEYRYAMDWGRIAWEAADFSAAEAAYLEATATERGSREPWPQLDLGRLYLFSDRLQEAAEAFEQAISIYEAFDTGSNLPSPAYVEAFFRLGQVRERQYALENDPALLQQAADNYRNALIGDPNYGPAQAALERLADSAP